MTRAQAINAYCRICIHDPRAAGTWREQVAICQCVDCPLWTYRPLPRNAPAWIASRNPLDLPDSLGMRFHDDAIAALRGKSNEGVNSARVSRAALDTKHRGATPIAGDDSSSETLRIRSLIG